MGDINDSTYDDMKRTNKDGISVTRWPDYFQKYLAVYNKGNQTFNVESDLHVSFIRILSNVKVLTFRPLSALVALMGNQCLRHGFKPTYIDQEVYMSLSVGNHCRSKADSAYLQK